MTRNEFVTLCNNKIIILDGATGSNLQDRGMPTGVSPEQWILQNSSVLVNLQKDFIAAGSDILYSPTFTANRIKLKEYGLADEIEEINRNLIKLSKKAIKDSHLGDDRKVFVAADLTMTGKQLYPIGNLHFEELVDIYKEQISYMLKEEIDLIVIETMMSLGECRAALIAAKEICDLPVMVTMTFEENLRTLYGTEPETAMVVLQSLGADAVGVNCGAGPSQIYKIVKRMKKYASIPIVAKPNAGLPKLINGTTVFNMTSEEFAEQTKYVVEAGASIIGGCCGTKPEHIQYLVKEISQMKPPSLNMTKTRTLTSERSIFNIDINGPFITIGERINPTGKKVMQDELKKGILDTVENMAQEQIKHGASILDINIGMDGINEKEMLTKTVQHLSSITDVPLCIDSSDLNAIESALRIYPGRALINSISLETEKFQKLLPIARKYGAMFILLPLSDKGLPKDADEKKNIIHTILEEAINQGFSKEDIIVDGLVTTIGANREAALQTLETIRYCKETLQLPTVIGLSNISFGLPQRQFINSTFLAFAIQAGLTMAIANPSQDLLVNTAFAADLLMGKDEADVRFINRMATRSNEQPKLSEPQNVEKTIEDNDIFQAVLKGNRKNITTIVKKSLEDLEPSDILDNLLIPAINEVGRLFDRQIYFLPQLISSAETMKLAIDYLEPMLQRDDNKKNPGTVIIASVAGDIHDIGKNLVVLMLKNYGYHVIDLGKDVPTETIIDTAKKEKADIIALSALMTTTMQEMKRVVQLKNETDLSTKVIIGGAVITQSYADEIGADGYSKDAQDAVNLVRKLLEGSNPN